MFLNFLDLNFLSPKNIISLMYAFSPRSILKIKSIVLSLFSEINVSIDDK